jgi:gas vesicle protein
MANDSHENVGSGTVLLAFLVGALTGAAVALLFAPASGEETREYLGQKARESKAKAQQAIEEGREVYERQRQGVASAFERGRDAFQQARGQGDESA